MLSRKEEEEIARDEVELLLLSTSRDLDEDGDNASTRNRPRTTHSEAEDDDESDLAVGSNNVYYSRVRRWASSEAPSSSSSTVLTTKKGLLFCTCLVLGTLFMVPAIVILSQGFLSNGDVDGWLADKTNKSLSSSTDPNVVLSSCPSLTELAKVQFQNYRNGSALILNVHITHHAGTTVCREIGIGGGVAPSFACMGDNGNVMNGTMPKGWPWSRNATATNIAAIRPYFHFVSWEFARVPSPPLSESDWEDPNLLSMIVMRHPIDRLLAGDGKISKLYPGLLQGNGTYDQWWAYATDGLRNTNNYALGILAGPNCCDGNQTDPVYLERAKALLSRFSVVLDQECLDDGLLAFARLANMSSVVDGWASRQRRSRTPHPPARDRIGHDDVYEYLLQKNKLDIELYEWSKTMSLVRC